MASGDNQRVILLWNTHSYQPFGNRLFGAAGAVLSLAFRPDGKELFSYDDSGTSLAWNLDPDQWVEWLCNLAQRNFTHSEWQQFFPEESYRPTCSQYP
jgi:WD40 repeat protein